MRGLAWPPSRAGNVIVNQFTSLHSYANSWLIGAALVRLRGRLGQLRQLGCCRRRRRRHASSAPPPAIEPRCCCRKGVPPRLLDGIDAPPPLGCQPKRPAVQLRARSRQGSSHCRSDRQSSRASTHRVYISTARTATPCWTRRAPALWWGRATTPARFACGGPIGQPPSHVCPGQSCPPCSPTPPPLGAHFWTCHACLPRSPSSLGMVRSSSRHANSDTCGAVHGTAPR